VLKLAQKWEPLGSPEKDMEVRPDLVVYGRDSQLVSAVEIRNKRGASREWASQMRWNLLSHEIFRAARFLLLATPDRVFLWKAAGGKPVPAPPDFEADGKALFAPYVRRAGLSPETISANAFELIVGNWLSSLILGIESAAGETQHWLVASGFLAAVQGGRTEHQLAA